MVPDEHINIYKRAWRERGFKKKYLRWYRSYDEVTLCFCIRNFKACEWYVILIGGLLNSRMTKPFPQLFDNAYIFNTRLEPTDYKAKNSGAILKPELAVSIAVQHFQHMTTLDEMVSYILNNELFGLTLDKISKRIYR